MFTFEFISDPYSLAVDPKCITEGMWVIMDYSRGGHLAFKNAIILGQLLQSDDGKYRVRKYGFFAHTRFSRDLEGYPELYKYTSKVDGDFKLTTSNGAAKRKLLTSKSGAPVYTVETWKELCPDWETSIPEEFWAPMTGEGRGWRP